jgi:hypothetical protein
MPRPLHEHERATKENYEHATAWRARERESERDEQQARAQQTAAVTTGVRAHTIAHDTSSALCAINITDSSSTQVSPGTQFEDRCSALVVWQDELLGSFYPWGSCSGHPTGYAIELNHEPRHQSMVRTACASARAQARPQLASGSRTRLCWSKNTGLLAK